MIEKIVNITLSRMTNEVHAQFHESVSTLIERTGPQTLKIEPFYDIYRNLLGNELEALAIITKSELTAQIAEQDRVRDSIFRGFSDTVKGIRNHFNPDYHQAANRLWNVFLHYGNIAKKTLDAQTAATNDIIRELRLPQNDEAVQLLELSAWIEKLDEENQKFQLLMMQRYNEQVAKTTHRMKTARVETDKFYRAITVHLDNRVLTGDVDDSTNEFLTELNAIVRRFKNILAQQFGKRKAND